MSWENYICSVCGCYKPHPFYPGCDDCNAAEFYDIIACMMDGEDVTDRWNAGTR